MRVPSLVGLTLLLAACTPKSEAAVAGAPTVLSGAALDSVKAVDAAFAAGINAKDTTAVFAVGTCRVHFPCMRSVSGWFVLGSILAVEILSACHARTQPETFGYCERNPPDSIAPPPIQVGVSADSPGVVVVHAKTSGRAAS